MSEPLDLYQVTFGKVKDQSQQSDVDVEDEDDDAPASAALIAILGFDPDEEDEEPETDAQDEWQESEHKRADNGQFGSGSGSAETPEPNFKTSSPKWQAEIDKLKQAHKEGDTETLAKAAKKYGPDTNLGKYVATLQGNKTDKPAIKIEGNEAPKAIMAKIKAVINSDGDADTAKLLGRDIEPAPTMEIPKDVKRTKANVSIDSLIPTQDIVDPNHLEKILGEQNRRQSSEVPLIINYEGHDYIADGHHRIVAAKLSGDKDVAVNRVSIKNIDWGDDGNMKVDWK